MVRTVHTAVHLQAPLYTTMAEDLQFLSTVIVWRYATLVFIYLYYFIHLFDQKSSVLTKAAFIW